MPANEPVFSLYDKTPWTQQLDRFLFSAVSISYRRWKRRWPSWWWWVRGCKPESWSSPCKTLRWPWETDMWWWSSRLWWGWRCAIRTEEWHPEEKQKANRRWLPPTGFVFSPLLCIWKRDGHSLLMKTFLLGCLNVFWIILFSSLWLFKCNVTYHSFSGVWKIAEHYED